jgi:16S rRNA A1518/A1519 N6-dimethyltransferase RsmA/KsgA/DIM1 with predicted DNA glycosylase/AP lyase activity
MIATSRDTRGIEYGDYQTPVSFARSVCSTLKKVYGLSPSVVIEPTFGTGNFINSAISEFDSISSVYGIEINSDYVSKLEDTLSESEVKSKVCLFSDDIFSFDFSDIKDAVSKEDLVLILGNPPWATNSQLSTLSSYNLPMKANFKGSSGFDAVTGKGNFDIAEYIILQMLEEFSRYNCVLAMLCKTIVAKNIIRDMQKYDFNISSADLFLFDAKEVFNVSCDAALFVVRLGNQRTSVCNVYDYYTALKMRQFGWSNGRFLADISETENTTDFDGKSPFEWRQGVKHDCSKVMELKPCGQDSFINAFGDIVKFSVGQYVYPLLKSSDIKETEIRSTKRAVIVTQKRVNDDTTPIAQGDIRVWEYLTKYEESLNGRRSIIYKKAPKFAMFGIGDYSFAKYKVGISGFYKEPIFSLIHSEFPVMLDDTCYFLGFDELVDSVITTALLNSSICKAFLKSVAFLDSKRPYTKEILKRIDLFKLSNVVPFAFVRDFAADMKGKHKVTVEQYVAYQSSIRPLSLFTDIISKEKPLAIQLIPLHNAIKEG